MKIRSDFTNGWIEKAVCLAMTGNLKEADICIERALKQDQSHPRAWYNKAAIAARLGNEEEMFNAIERAISIDAGVRSRLRNDKDFEKYWQNPEFVQKTG